MSTKAKATKVAKGASKPQATEAKVQRVGRFRVSSKKHADEVATALASRGYLVAVKESKKKRNDELNFAGSIRIKPSN